MKKKAIEKIPYFGLKKTSRKKDVKYIGVTEVKIIGHEKYLFLEVYRNKKESKEMPLVRIVLTKKDFGTYWPEKEEWTRQKIKPDSCYGRVIWGEGHPTWEQEKKENILQSTEDLERIKKFCKANVYNEEHWWEYIYKHEDDIVITSRRNREHKAYMRRQEALADRMAHTKELPEKEILDRADRLYFHNQHYLYYKKHGCWAHIACSKCGGVTDARWKSGISYESQFQRWTDEQVEHLAETDLSGTQVEMATRYMTLQKLLNRIEKYSGCEYGTECSSASARIRHTATTYADYLSMRINLGYDLNNTVYQQPQDLEAEHNKMVMETNKEEMDKHLKEVAERYPEIRHVYRKLRNKYLYEDDRYIIRPARSAEEIVMEGRLLHHCVGGNTYLDKHNTGKTYILMLRFKEEPDVPYITVEIDAKNPRILQWYGDKDKKPDEKNMQSWLNTWLMKLKTGTLTETIQTAAIA